MKSGDYSEALEAIAREAGQSPLVVLEVFLERAAIREFEGGFARDEAERLALADTAESLRHSGTQQHGYSETQGPEEPTNV